MTFEIAISTCDRDPSYVHETIASMVRDPNLSSSLQGRARLMVDGDAGYVDDYADVFCVEAIHRSFIDRARRILHNFCGVLACPYARSMWPDLLALQDDVWFQRHWVQALEEAVQASEKATDGRGILTLYCTKRVYQRPIDRIEANHFYGNQALYLPGAVRAELFDFITKRIAAGDHRPDDMMVKKFCMETDCEIYAVNPNLVQHIGGQSTIGSAHHRSPSFPKSEEPR